MSDPEPPSRPAGGPGVPGSSLPSAADGRDAEEPEALRFQDAYEELMAITRRLGGDEDLDPDVLVALLERGKGLERALRDRLAEVEQRITRIEAGHDLPRFRITTGREGGDT